MIFLCGFATGNTFHLVNVKNIDYSSFKNTSQCDVRVRDLSRMLLIENMDYSIFKSILQRDAIQQNTTASASKSDHRIKFFLTMFIQGVV